MLRLLCFVAVTLVAALALTSSFQQLTNFATFAQSIQQCRTFRETGKTVCGKFLVYWEQHGGVVQFGYPISDEFGEVSELNGKEYKMQYFERAVFELHPENKAPYDVLLAQLGTLSFRSKYPNGQPGGPYVDNLPAYPGSQNMKVEGSTDNGGSRKVVTFTTVDKSDLVLAFYKDVMAKNGWTVRVDPNYPNELDFIYPTTPDQPLYALYLSTAQPTPTLTQVKLDLQVTYRR